MIRKIIHIDEEKCNGCGICANACHEGAIDIVDGKAKLMREHFCDGFGDCLPGCPTGAITFEEREAPEYDEAAVKEAKEAKEAKELLKKENAKELEEIKAAAKAAVEAAAQGKTVLAKGPAKQGGGCPGTRMRQIRKNEDAVVETQTPNLQASGMQLAKPVSRLTNWPVQIKLAPITAPYFDGAKLLIAADCTAYAYASFHEDFIKGKTTLIGCPKLDAIDYSEKLTQIIAKNNIKSVTIVRMEVPCCGGLEMAAKRALQASGKFIPWQVVTIGIDGSILD